MASKENIQANYATASLFLSAITENMLASIITFKIFIGQN